MAESKHEYFRLKREGETRRPRKSLLPRSNHCSADYIFPSHRVGCPVYCSYCYVARHRPDGNPLEIYTNIDELIAHTVTFFQQLGPKPRPTQQHPTLWSVDIGESTDLLAPENITSANYIIDSLLRYTDNVQPTFATKLGHPSNVDKLIVPVQDQARVRMSLSPQVLIDRLEIGTSNVEARLAGANAAFAKGYEVHLNFSPIVLFAEWEKYYYELLEQTADMLGPNVRKQLKCEAIMLTHHEKLHDKNMEWNPGAEHLLWQPEVQETKTNQRGAQNILRYRVADVKPAALRTFVSMLRKVLPGCKVRYAF